VLRAAAFGVGLLVLTAADAPPAPPAPPTAAVTQEELNQALYDALKASKVAQLKLEMMQRQYGNQPRNVEPPVVNVAAPAPPVVNVTSPTTPVESTTSAIIRQARDAALPVFMAGFLAFLAVVSRNIPAAVSALDQWIQLKLTVHQQDRVYAAVQTAAGQIETKIDRGAMTIGEVSEDNVKVRQIVSAALAPVKESAAAQGATVDSLAPVVVGRVDTNARVIKPATVVVKS
jgi:hypothetical protein